MAQSLRDNSTRTQAYQHETETRTNIPSPGLAPGGDIAEVPQSTYYYNPHLQPILRSAGTDSLSSYVESLLRKAQQEVLTPDEAQQLADALHAQPWLEWANKREKGETFTVDPVPLFIHERLSAQAILETAKRNDIQRSLFADPQQKYQEAVQFYEHEVPWSNRLILGDSLQVMDSLSNREGLAGQVQMIYIDPPYGINFRSNFQPDVFSTRSSGDSDKYLTREIEQIKAYRDTWKLGIHSYLSYLRQRLVVARELLRDSGSIFVQIGSENLHRVRCLMDEVFRSENFVSLITFTKTSPLGSKLLASRCDYIIWFARNKSQCKYHPLFISKDVGEGSSYKYVELTDGSRRKMTQQEQQKPSLLPDGVTPFTIGDLLSTGFTQSCYYDFPFKGGIVKQGRYSWKTTEAGMKSLIGAERVWGSGVRPGYVRKHSDFPVRSLDHLWNDMGGAHNHKYIVETNTKVIQRCMLMTTDPGDVVLDPTCGGGTTAYVAEKWGRRWITIDTSRIAITLARTRLLTATYDYYKIKDKPEGIGSGLVLKTAPHIQLRDITNNVALDPIFAEYEPKLTEKLADLNAILKEVTPEIRQELFQKLVVKKKRDVTEADRRRWDLPKTAWEEWEVPFDTDPSWPKSLQKALIAYRKVWQEKMEEVNTCIAESVKQEELVDQPEIDRNLLRVSGPFTIESLQPLAVSLDKAATSVALDTEPANAAAYLEQMYLLLKTSGADFENKKKHFTRLNRLEGNFFHADGQFENDKREVGIVFGPQHGPITALQVESCLREARRIYDVLLFAGFHFEPEAQAIIQDEHRNLQTHLVQIAPDVAMNDLLRQTHSDKLFTVIGAPRIEVKEAEGGQFRVVMEGVDTYNPVDNTIEPTQADQVAAWFVDSNYDGRTFCPTHSFFPNKDAWKNIAKSLKSMIDEEILETFSGTESLPFSAGEHKCVAVKVIDRRGNELMRIHKL